MLPWKFGGSVGGAVSGKPVAGGVETTDAEATVITSGICFALPAASVMVTTRVCDPAVAPDQEPLQTPLSGSPDTRWSVARVVAPSATTTPSEGMPPKPSDACTSTCTGL